MRLPAFEQGTIPGHEHGGAIVAEGYAHPWRFVLHSTEGGTIDSNVGTFARTGDYPHLLASPAEGRVLQLLDTNESATALVHPPQCETNRLRTLQVEIVGFATEIPNWPDVWLEWLGVHLLVPLLRAFGPGQFGANGLIAVAPAFVAYPASYGAGAPQRMSVDTWLAFNGVCGHEHVPGNEHGDPGALNIARVLQAANAVLHPLPPAPPAPKVRPMYAPPLQIAARLRNPDGGLWEAHPGGHVDYITPRGDVIAGGLVTNKDRERWQAGASSPRVVARLEPRTWTTTVRVGPLRRKKTITHPGYTVVATDGHRTVPQAQGNP